MNQTSIFMPVMALIGWTFLVLLVIPYRRFKAAFAGRVTTHDFKVGESANVPPDVSIPNRNYMNLLEAPLLFYVVCIVFFLTNHVSAGAVALAWSYFALRVLHSVIYLTYNKVFHRFLAFAMSNVLLVLLWGKLMLELSR